MTYAPEVYRALRGVFCIYKPAGQSMRGAMYALQTKLAAGENMIGLTYWGGDRIADEIFKFILLNQNNLIWIQISLDFVHKLGPI